MLLLQVSAGSTVRAACLHLLLVPLTAPYLQLFAMEGGALTSWLCRAAMLLGTTAALILLLLHASRPATAPGILLIRNATTIETLAQPSAHGLVALALCLGCAQLLCMVHKENVLRVMACTAAAVVVAALAVAAAFGPLHLARRFLQATVLPLLLLFAEASRRGRPGPPGI